MPFTARPRVRSVRRAPRSLAGALAAALAGVLALAACTPSAGAPVPTSAPSGTPSGSSEPGDLLADHGLDGLEPRQIIDRLDALPVDERPVGLLASVRPDVLVLSDADRELALPMPEEFYVSVAPYRSQTHDCVFHSLTTCLGELPNEEFRVAAIDAATGETILDEVRTSFDNGFIGLWLPRGGQIELRIEDAAGGASTATVDTSALDAASCITTMRLG